MIILFGKFSMGLRLFKGVRLFQTLEYAQKNIDFSFYDIFHSYGKELVVCFFYQK